MCDQNLNGELTIFIHEWGKIKGERMLMTL